jgi:hypothetical protein
MDLLSEMGPPVFRTHGHTETMIINQICVSIRKWIEIAKDTAK